MAAAAIALIWANSPVAASYERLWATKITIDVGGMTLSESLLHWVNDGLMAIFSSLSAWRSNAKFWSGS